MNNILLMLEKIIPEGIESFKIRYTLLQIVLENGPIGRRGLAALTTYSERTIRTTIDLLSKEGLIEVAHKGMIITEEGKIILDQLYTLFYESQKLPQLEKQLEELLEAKRVIVVPGDVDDDATVKWNIGKAAANLLPEIIEDNYTIAITGGSTVAKMVEVLSPMNKSNITLIPARGNVGKRVELQATTLAAIVAKKVGGKYEALSVPDNLSKASIETIKQEPRIEKTLQKMAESDMIMLGLGNAMKMAERRDEDETTLQLLTDKEAVAEVFRYYFNKEGEVVYSTKNIGIDLEDAMKIPKKVILAGGSSKAKAILAVKTLLRGSYLIIDEGIANKILS